MHNTNGTDNIKHLLMNVPRYNAEKEYETLRSEMLQGKQYVFERPILIITASIAFIQFVDKQYAIYFPLIIIGLLSFNLWFTVNRMGSMARIIAYIQLVLENDESNWYGWETSLRNYRKWLKLNRKSVDQIQIEDEAVYDNLGYYPTIFYMHIIVTVLVFLILAIFSINHLESSNITWSLLTLGLLVLFIGYAIKNRPNKIKPKIEKNRQIWRMVFIDWEKLTN
jgi:hypothetical protein